MEYTIISIRKDAKKLKIKKPILVEGLPGIGLVGKIAADYLIREKKAKRIGTIYSPHFPPQVLMRKNGIIRMLGMRLYHIPQPKNDLIVIVGDVQAGTPEAHFEVADKIVKYFRKQKGEMIITLGGYGNGKRSDPPAIYGAATHKELVGKYSKFGIEFGKTRGSIIGAAGLLLGVGKMQGLKGICIMGETHGGYVDPKSAFATLNMLAKVLDMKVDTADFEKKVNEGEKFIKKMEEQAAKAQAESGGGGAPAPHAHDLSYIR